MNFGRKKFLSLSLKSIGLIALSPLIDILNACTWRKKEEDPIPKNGEDQLINPSISSTIKLIEPKEKSIVEVNKNTEIKWECSNVDYVDIYFSSDGGATWDVIVNRFLASGLSYSWIVPSISSSSCLIQILNSNNAAIRGQSNDYFRVASITRLDLASQFSLQTVGGYLLYELSGAGSVIIIRKSVEEFKVLSLICTHNGCLINYNGSSEFNCSCHGSKFNSNGEVLQGPAQDHLDEYEGSYVSSENKLLIFV